MSISQYKGSIKTIEYFCAQACPLSLTGFYDGRCEWSLNPRKGCIKTIFSLLI